ncbi:hypothetical protein [Parasphingorhabdus sp.]|uniref:hypothetical protein n=1 Tax=Parasphingorhabdus sp. TaxID=2709688 RepID=UPI003A900A66
MAKKKPAAGNMVPPGPLCAAPDAEPGTPRKARHDGWTAATRTVFLATLRKAGCVRDACRVAGMSSTSAYRLRDRDGEFAEQWKKAQAAARTGLIAVAHERAVVGRETVIMRGGKEFERRITPSDAILALLIKQGKLGELDADKLITWDEWQRGIRFDEQGNKIDEREEADAVRKSLDTKLGDMRMKLLARRAKAEERMRAAEARAEELEARNGIGDGD